MPINSYCWIWVHLYNFTFIKYWSLKDVFIVDPAMVAEWSKTDISNSSRKYCRLGPRFKSCSGHVIMKEKLWLKSSYNMYVMCKMIETQTIEGG